MSVQPLAFLLNVLWTSKHNQVVLQNVWVQLHTQTAELVE